MKIIKKDQFDGKYVFERFTFHDKINKNEKIDFHCILTKCKNGYNWLEFRCSDYENLKTKHILFELLDDAIKYAEKNDSNNNDLKINAKEFDDDKYKLHGTGRYYYSNDVQIVRFNMKPNDYRKEYLVFNDYA